MKKQKKPGCIIFVLTLLFVAIFVFSIMKVLEIYHERAVGASAYTALEQNVVKVQTAQMEETETAVPETPEITWNVPAIEVDFESLKEVNPQTVAWIRSDDGTINYPVVQGEDNEHYLHHLIDGTPNRNGSIFLDCRNAPDFSDRNTFIHGHNMQDGTMFAGLTRYSEPDFYEQHPFLQLVTPAGNWCLEVFAAGVVTNDSPVYLMTYGVEGFSAYLENVRAISAIKTPVEVDTSDRLVTLSTCAYEFEDAKFVVVCKLVPMR